MRGLSSPGDFSPGRDRVANALVSYTSYLHLLFWTAAWPLFYPHPGQWPGGTGFLSGIVLAAITIAVFVLRGVIPGWASAGLVSGVLVPVSGIVQTGYQPGGPVNVHPLIGPAVMLAWGVRTCWAVPVRAGRRRSWQASYSMSICAMLSWHQAHTGKIGDASFEIPGGDKKKTQGPSSLGLASRTGSLRRGDPPLGISLVLREGFPARKRPGCRAAGCGPVRGGGSTVPEGCCPSSLTRQNNGTTLVPRGLARSAVRGGFPVPGGPPACARLWVKPAKLEQAMGVPPENFSPQSVGITLILCLHGDERR